MTLRAPDTDKGSLHIVREKHGVTITVRSPGSMIESKIAIPWADWLILREAGQ